MAAALGLMRQFNRISSCALPRRLSQIRYLHSERLLHKFCTPRSPLKARTIQPNFQKGILRLQAGKSADGAKCR